MNDKFKEKVQSMTAKEIIMAMVNGLKAEHVRVDMDNFGYVRDGICFGCAATNAVCEIAGKVLEPSHFSDDDPFNALANCVGTKDVFFISDFELAIDALRLGDLDYYNSIANELRFAEIKAPAADLPELTSANFRENLGAYIALAEAQA